MEEQNIEFYSKEEYLVLEEQAEYKSEYEHGKIKAMSGGTINHSLIGGNIVYLLNKSVAEKNKDCYVFNSEARIFIQNADSYVYPDAMLTCNEIKNHVTAQHAVTNPILVVEVLSDSTEQYDRGAKLQKYRSLSSFREYVLIDQYQPLVDVLFRENSYSWNMISTIGLDKSIYLNTLDCYIPMKDIYRNVKGLKVFPPTSLG